MLISHSVTLVYNEGLKVAKRLQRARQSAPRTTDLRRCKRRTRATSRIIQTADVTLLLYDDWGLQRRLSWAVTCRLHVQC